MKIIKKGFWMLVVVVIVLGGIYFSVPPKDEVSPAGGLQDYKKAVYESLVCQYNCPLSAEVEINGVIQKFPQSSCGSRCVEVLKSEGYKSGMFSEEEILGDELFADIDGVLKKCQREGISESGSTDNEKFYGCVRDGLAELKEDYDYLSD